MPFAKRCSEWVVAQATNHNVGAAEAIAPLIAVTSAKKLMNFLLKTRNCVLKIRNFALK